MATYDAKCQRVLCSLCVCCMAGYNFVGDKRDAWERNRRGRGYGRDGGRGRCAHVPLHLSRGAFDESDDMNHTTRHTGASSSTGKSLVCD